MELLAKKINSKIYNLRFDDIKDRQWILKSANFYDEAVKYYNWKIKYKDDPFIEELSNVYGSPQQKFTYASFCILSAIIRCSKRYGVRFLSISNKDLITFEGGTWDRWPIAWRITAVLGCSYCGNTNQSQLILNNHKPFPLVDEHVGVYDIRDKHPKKIGKIMTLEQINFTSKKYNETNLSNYLSECHVELLETPVVFFEINTTGNLPLTLIDHPSGEAKE